MTQSLLVLSDLHLSTLCDKVDLEIVDWARERVASSDPEHLVLNGDIFELSFRATDTGTNRQRPEHVASVLNTYTDLFAYLNSRRGLERVTFVVGDHDFMLNDPIVSRHLADLIPRAQVRVTDHYYDPTLRMLVFHGHQLDYNSTPPGNAAGLTDDLTAIFEAHVFATPALRAQLDQSYQLGQFSFWYAAGGLPDYLELLEVHYAQPRLNYYAKLSEILRSTGFANWISSQRNGLNRTVGRIARLANILGPRFLSCLARPWARAIDATTRHRLKDILRRGVDSRLLGFELFDPIECVVVGHLHRAEEMLISVGETAKYCYSTTAPRWHASPGGEKQISLFQDHGFVSADAAQGIVFHKSHNEKCISVPN